jgi:spore germination cell wall hydrolase CwlJ-like protein
MKKRTWKKVVAALLVCVTIVSSPFNAFASGEIVQITGVTGDAEVTNIEETDTTETVSEDTTTNVTTKDTATTKKSTSTKKSSKKKSYTSAQLRLMSAIIYCEAGSEPFAGKLAVGIVIMNRVRSGKFPNNIKSVIYQKSQFTPARSGALSRALANYDKGKFTTKYHKDCIRAAKKALSGTKTVTYNKKTINMKSYLFFSVYLKGSRIKIGHHNFK